MLHIDLSFILVFFQGRTFGPYGGIWHTVMGNMLFPIGRALFSVLHYSNPVVNNFTSDFLTGQSLDIIHIIFTAFYFYNIKRNRGSS